MKILAIVKKLLKMISITLVLLVLLLGLIYIAVSPYPSSPRISRVFNAKTTPCKTIDKETGKKGILIVTPNITYSEDTVAIHISGLEPFEIGSLKLYVRDSKNILWQSTACFQANELGEIHPKNQEPLKGSAYQGIHPMGLFWSLQPEKLSSFNFDTDLRFHLRFSTAKGDTLATSI